MNDLRTELELDQKLATIHSNLQEGGHGYWAAASICAVIIELVLKAFIKQRLMDLPKQDRDKFMEWEKQIGNGRSFEDLTLGKLVDLLRQSQFINAWSRATGRTQETMRIINLDAITELRNSLQHQDRKVQKHEAELLLQYVWTLLDGFGIMSPTDMDHLVATTTPAKTSLDAEAAKSTVATIAREEKHFLPDRPSERSKGFLTKEMVPRQVLKALAVVAVILIAATIWKVQGLHSASAPSTPNVVQSPLNQAGIDLNGINLADHIQCDADGQGQFDASGTFTLKDAFYADQIIIEVSTDGFNTITKREEPNESHDSLFSIKLPAKRGEKYWVRLFARSPKNVIEAKSNSVEFVSP